jgi:adenylate kinase
MAGTGKSTQGQLIAEYLKCPWVSVGNILRAHMSGKYAKQMLAGELIDDEQMFPLLEEELKRLGADKNEVILDGSPRTMDQAEWLAEKINSGELSLTAIIHLKVSKEIAKKRLLSRGRPDDHEQAINERFAEYEKVIVPIMKYLKEQGFRIYDINTERSQDEIAEDIEEKLGFKS